MLYQIEGNQLKKIEKMKSHGLYFIDTHDLDIIKDIDEYAIIKEELESRHIRFESHLHYDIIMLPSEIHNRKSKNRCLIYASKDRSIFVARKKHFSSFIKELTVDDTQITVGKLLHKLLREISEAIGKKIEDTENEALELENRVMKVSMPKNVSEEILKIRKELLHMKRDFNGILDIIDSMIENENKLFSEIELKQFDIEKNRMDRNYNHVGSLMEYITEIREAYQSATDNRLNDIMKLFTIISAIFLPLTLLVGWYGMNLQMPELHWEYSYPVVIVVSILIVVFCIYYFKKNKWF